MFNMTTSVAPATTVTKVTGKKEFKSFADFNTVSFEARVYNVDIVTRGTDEWANVSLITNTVDGEGGGLVVTFTNSNGILSLAKKGFLPSGRRVFVSGVIKSVTSHYTKDGECVALKTPRMHLVDASLKLGATPKAKA